jgi:hypothetical protein
MISQLIPIVLFYCALLFLLCLKNKPSSLNKYNHFTQFLISNFIQLLLNSLGMKTQCHQPVMHRLAY